MSHEIRSSLIYSLNLNCLMTWNKRGYVGVKKKFSMSFYELKLNAIFAGLRRRNFFLDEKIKVSKHFIASNAPIL